MTSTMNITLVFEGWGRAGGWGEWIEQFLFVAGPKVKNIFQRDQKS